MAMLTISAYKEAKKNYGIRSLLYEDILPGIPDILGCNYFNQLNLYASKETNLPLKAEISFFMNEFFDATNKYEPLYRNVYYQIARILYSIDKVKKWCEKEESRSDYNYEIVDVYQIQDDYNLEFDAEIKASTLNWEYYEQFLDLRIESGLLIAAAFKMIHENNVPEPFLGNFCNGLEELIEFVGHTEFYNTEVIERLEDYFDSEINPSSI